MDYQTFQTIIDGYPFFYGGFIGAALGAIGGFLSGGSALAATAGSLAGGLLQRSDQRQAASRANRFSADMSNTAYQRAMADMRAAGLNPILAARLGGASTPTGAVAETTNVFQPAVSSALETARTSSQVNLQNQQVEKLAAEIGLTEEQTEQVKEATAKITEEIEYIRANTTYRKAIAAIPELVERVLDTYLTPVMDKFDEPDYSKDRPSHPWYTDRGIYERLKKFLEWSARETLEIWIRDDSSAYPKTGGEM